MSTLKLSTLSNLAGSQSTAVENAINGSAKAWVNFNGTGTVAIRASYNVSSITDNGTGDYTVNFTNTLSDSNYAAVISVKDDNGGAPIISFRYSGGLYTTTQLQLQAWTYTGSPYDSSIINATVFR